MTKNQEAIFKSRAISKEKYDHNGPNGQIVARILRLGGLEEGDNKGKNAEGECVDTYDRYVYIHGTNQEDLIGQSASAGCVRMRIDDIIELCDKTPISTLVYITK